MKLIKENWFKIIIVLLVAFAIYWFGIRPVQIRKECSVANGHTDAVIIPPETATPNWPRCQYGNSTSSNPVVGAENISPTCHSGRDGSVTPASDWQRPATSAQYDQCIRHAGL
jgi:hypothetical protein